jgi:N-methylhydantoinase A
VTDAYVLSGLIDPADFLGGELPLSRALAERALAGLGERLGLAPAEVAAGILRVATANMYAEFLPLMAQHGVDHRQFALLAYGGAGPTHAFLLAREVGIDTVVVPPSPLCALGCLLADLRADYVRTVYVELEEAALASLVRTLDELERLAHAWLEDERVPPGDRQLVRSADVRYRGQSFEVTVGLPRGGVDGLRALPELFHARHRVVYGFADPTAAVEVINLRVQGVGAVARPDRLAPRPGRGVGPVAPRGARAGAGHREIMLDGVKLGASVHRRAELAPGASIPGPAIVVQYDTTVVVPPGFRLTVDPWQNLVGERQ